MLPRSLRRLVVEQKYQVRRYMTTQQKVDVVSQMKTYPFLKKFMYDPQDPIKQKYEIIKDWSDQCHKNPEITEKQLKVLRQRYELASLYEDETISESNSFLKDIFERIKDDPEYDRPNTRTLTDAQFEVTKRILKQHMATTQFVSKASELIEKSKEDIDKLPYKKFDYARYEKSVKAWGTYKFLSYGHPKMVELYQTMVENGGDLSCEQVRDVVHYMKQQNNYSFSNKELKDALKWFARMDWTFDHKYADDIYQKHIYDYFDILTTRYKNIKSILEDEVTLKRCQYKQNEKGGDDQTIFEPETKDIELWLQKLSKKEHDPLIGWLKENLSDGAVFSEIQDAIVNRFQLDIGGVLVQHSDVLIPLLQNQHLYQVNPEEIKRERYNVLIGKELTEDYLMELKKMITSLQEEFMKTI